MKILPRLLLLCYLFGIQTAFSQSELVEMPEGRPNFIQQINDTLLFSGYYRYQQLYVYRSADFGRHWDVLPDSMYLGYSPFQYADGRLYASGGDKLRYSTDMGQTWQNYNHPATNWHAAPIAYWRDTVLLNQAQSVLVRAFPDGSLDTVWQDPNGAEISDIKRIGDRFFVWTPTGLSFSDDVGENWTTSNLPALPAGNYGRLLTQSGSRLFAWADFSTGSTLYRSEDNGLTWNQEPFFVQNGVCKLFELFRSNRSSYLITDCKSVDGDSSLLWRIPDDAANWEIYQPFELADHPVIELDSVQVATGAYSIFRSTDDGLSWQTCPADAGRAPGNAYVVWPDGAASISITPGTFNRQHDQTPYNWLPDVGKVNDYTSCVLWSVQHGDSIALGCQDHLSFSFDRGATWTPVYVFPVGQYVYKLFWDEDGLNAQISLDLASSESYFAHWSFTNQAWEDPRQAPYFNLLLEKSGHTLYQGLDNNKISVSGNLGLTWQQTGNVFSPAALYTSVQAAGGSVFVRGDAPSAGLYVSKDQGITWQRPKMNYGTPVTFFSEIVGRGEDLFAILNIADGFGFSHEGYSDDGGVTWFHVPELEMGPELRIFSDDSLLYFNSQYRIYRNRISWYRGQHARVEVFTDTNGDGLRDPQEPAFPGVVVFSQSGYGITDSTGHTRLTVAASGDTLRVYPVLPGAATIPAFHAVSGLDSLYSFGVHLNNDADLSVLLNNNGPARPGFDGNYTLTALNQGNLSQNAVVKAVFDPAVSLLQANPPVTQISGDTLIWQLGTLAAFEKEVVQVKLNVSPGIPIGTVLLHRAWVGGDLAEQSPIDNLDSLLETVVGSYDPNDKQVQPAGNITPAEVLQGAELSYNINFQNTGNYPAEKVVIKDTLQAGLDIRTFRLLAASHPCTVELKEPGVVTFTFSNIQLPDSVHDQAGSHGFVRYAVFAKSNLPLGAQIRNTAHIYFDFNSPITTNTVATPVAEDSIVSVENLQADLAGLGLKVTPNPFHSDLRVQVNIIKPGVLDLYVRDATGRLMTNLSAGWLQTGVHDFQMPVQEWPAGVYWLECRLGYETRRVQVVRQ
jgi:uncharacterized repeat protein (TIGR01451 family)